MLLLDTHAWLWLANDDVSLGKSARAALLSAATESSLYLSPISIWEVALKASRGRLQLDLPIRTWVRKAVNLTQVHLAPITAEIACGCAELPTDFHGDPADRLIAATARNEGMTLLTHDRALLALSKKGFFQAIPT